jgi:Tetratricopeptide repeat
MWWRAWGTVPVPEWIAAAECYRDGQFTRAIGLYESGFYSSDTHRAATSARLDLSYCLFREGRIREAEAHLLKVIVDNPLLREGYVRLSRLFLWIGSPNQAVELLFDAAERVPFDQELSALLIFAVLESSAPRFMLENALAMSEIHQSVKGKKKNHSQLLATSAAHLLLHSGETQKAYDELNRCILQGNAPLEAYLLRAKWLVQEKKYIEAREDLLQCLMLQPGHPESLSMLSRLYLATDVFDQPGYALNLAVLACQSSGWMSGRELLVLAEVYMRAGDSHLALMMAEKAKKVRESRGGSPVDPVVLDTFITILEDEVGRETLA